MAAIAFLLLFAHRHPQQEEQSPPGISVVFENGGQKQVTAPPSPRRGPDNIAQTPPPAAPAPPPQPQTAQTPPEVHLNMPNAPFATVQSTPEPQPEPQQKPKPHQVVRPRPPQKYIVMNNMSYGNPATPLPNAKRALNLSLPESDAQAATASNVSVKGDIGADWGAELTKWVDEHAYYPQAAVEQGQQGTAEVEFTVDRAGNVTGVHLLRSAGSPFLDQAWFQLFAENHLPAFPSGTKSNHVTVDYTVHYQLIP